jgi:hypothetical protein
LDWSDRERFLWRRWRSRVTVIGLIVILLILMLLHLDNRAAVHLAAAAAAAGARLRQIVTDLLGEPAVNAAEVESVLTREHGGARGLGDSLHTDRAVHLGMYWMFGGEGYAPSWDCRVQFFSRLSRRCLSKPIPLRLSPRVKAEAEAEAELFELTHLPLFPRVDASQPVALRKWPATRTMLSGKKSRTSLSASRLDKVCRGTWLHRDRCSACYEESRNPCSRT